MSWRVIRLDNWTVPHNPPAQYSKELSPRHEQSGADGHWTPFPPPQSNFLTAREPIEGSPTLKRMKKDRGRRETPASDAEVCWLWELAPFLW